VPVIEQRRGLQHGVAGAELRLLANEGQPRCRRGGLDLGGAMAGDDNRARCAESAGRVQDMLQ
jgi:hypothetical protein